MAGLIVDSTLEVETQHGLCKIELCLGSITQLQDPVDVLVISAFPGKLFFCYIYIYIHMYYIDI